MINEKCAECVHCEVCAFTESETAKAEACDFFDDREFCDEYLKKAIPRKCYGCRGCLSIDAVEGLIHDTLKKYIFNNSITDKDELILSINKDLCSFIEQIVKEMDLVRC